jgi:hypothetical protein
MGMQSAELATEAGIPLFSATVHTGLTRADLQSADGGLGQDASRQRQLRLSTWQLPVVERLSDAKLVF